MNKIKWSILGSIFAASGLSNMMAYAAGFVTLPTSGASAYVTCRSGNGLDNTLPPAADSSCVAPSGVGVALNINSSPEAGFTLQNANSTTITAFSETLGTLNERVFRDGGSGQCIYAKQILYATGGAHDYNPYASGTNGLQMDDIAFGGYIGAVSAGYAKINASQSSVIRTGRTFTSVQLQWQGNSVCPGFLLNPAIGGILGTEINGVGLVMPCTVMPTLAQQSAQPSQSWVDFTVGTPYNNSAAPNLQTYGVRSCIATFLILDSRHGQTTTHRV